MTLILCPGCGFVKVQGTPCACCAKDLNTDLLCMSTLPSPQIHHVRVESYLTHRANGGYVHVTRATCEQCGESYYSIIHATHALSPDVKQRADYHAAHGFSEMIASEPCRGK